MRRSPPGPVVRLATTGSRGAVERPSPGPGQPIQCQANAVPANAVPANAVPANAVPANDSASNDGPINDGAGHECAGDNGAGSDNAGHHSASDLTGRLWRCERAARHADRHGGGQSSDQDHAGRAAPADGGRQAKLRSACKRLV